MLKVLKSHLRIFTQLEIRTDDGGIPVSSNGLFHFFSIWKGPMNSYLKQIPKPCTVVEGERSPRRRLQQTQYPRCFQINSRQ
ncbi:hypothetical protein AAC387_Pa05g3709 [Persea americana]